MIITRRWLEDPWCCAWTKSEMWRASGALRVVYVWASSSRETLEG